MNNDEQLFRDDDVPEVLDVLPKASSDWMFGHREQPNAFVFVRDGVLNILPSNGGWLGVDVNLLEGDIAPFSD